MYIHIYTYIYIYIYIHTRGPSGILRLDTSKTGTRLFSCRQFLEMLRLCCSERYVSLEGQVPIKLGTHEAGAERHAVSPTLVRSARSH